jgi:hypothetical protein
MNMKYLGLCPKPLAQKAWKNRSRNRSFNVRGSVAREWPGMESV